MANVINNTTKTQPDGKLIYVAYDSKAQNLGTFYKNLYLRGFNYQVLIISSTPDDVIKNHDAYQQANSKFIKDNSIMNNESAAKEVNISSAIPIMFVSTADAANNVAKIQNNILKNQAKAKLEQPEESNDIVD